MHNVPRVAASTANQAGGDSARATTSKVKAFCPAVISLETTSGSLRSVWPQWALHISFTGGGLPRSVRLTTSRANPVHRETLSASV